MYCWKCGAPNDEEARKCVQCDAYLRREAPARRRRSGAISRHAHQRGGHIPNYLVPAILCTIFCCLPFGIVAIVFAAQVDSKASAGDIDGARQASNNALTWCWLAFGLGLAGVLIGLLGGFVRM